MKIINRKLKIILSIVVLLNLSMFSIAFSAVIGTSHDMESVIPSHKSGLCSVCHIAHSRGLLWPTPDRSIGEEGFIGNVCFSCHSSNAYGAAALIEASFAERYVFPGIGVSKYSHGHDISDKYNDGTINSELPRVKEYVITDGSGELKSGNEIQCTTCHDVHTNDPRPFLRFSINELCTKCHIDDNAHTEVEPPDDIRDKLMLFDNIIGATDGFVGDGKGRWNLGQHAVSEKYTDGVPGLGQSGKIVCVSCHAVHGVQDDSDANVPIDLPRPLLLPRYE